MVAAGRRAVADGGAALGRGRLLDRVQVVEQREPGGVGEGAHRARVGQGERALERDLSKLLFREPGVKHRRSFSRSRPAGGSAGASPLRTHASVSRTVSSSGRVSSPAANAARGVDREHPAVLGRMQPQRQLHPLADVVLDEEGRSRPRRARRRRRPRRGTSRAARARVVGRRRRCTSRETVLGGATIHAARSRTSITCAAASGGRCEHGPALREPRRPVREAAGRVPRPDDQTRSQR